jgi:hypothetical protein
MPRFLNSLSTSSDKRVSYINDAFVSHVIRSKPRWRGVDNLGYH